MEHWPIQLSAYLFSFVWLFLYVLFIAFFILHFERAASASPERRRWKASFRDKKGTFQLHNARRRRDKGNSRSTTWDTGGLILTTRPKHTGLLFISSDSCYDSAQKAWDTRPDSMGAGQAGKDYLTERESPTHLHRMDSKRQSANTSQKKKKSQNWETSANKRGAFNTHRGIGVWLSQCRYSQYLGYSNLQNHASRETLEGGQKTPSNYLHNENGYYTPGPPQALLCMLYSVEWLLNTGCQIQTNPTNIQIMTSVFCLVKLDYDACTL